MLNDIIDSELEFDVADDFIDFNLEFESSQNNFDLMEEAEVVPIYYKDDHRDLKHRNDDNQHTISSITGLGNELEGKANVEDLEEKLEESDLNELNNQEIQTLWNKFIK